jgi:hypothetical protein
MSVATSMCAEMCWAMAGYQCYLVGETASGSVEVNGLYGAVTQLGQEHFTNFGTDFFF